VDISSGGRLVQVLAITTSEKLKHPATGLKQFETKTVKDN
jgi:hypothetical protein